MIADLKPHAAYKESGQRWLGDIPRQWDSFPLYRVATPKSECGRTDLELLSVYLHRGVIRYADSGGQVHKPSLDLSKYQVVDSGDFVLNNQQAWRGSIGVSKFKGIISPAYVVLRLSPKLNSDYANYLFRSTAMVAQYVIASRGVGDIQRNLFYPDLRNSIAIVPPPAEQAAIVRFLDWANGRLERAIRAKRKVITLLNEQKQAIIHRAVTCGLDFSVPLKPSGVPWVGDIPEHWELRRLRTLVHRIDQGVSPLAVGFLAEGDSWGVLKSGCVNRGVFRETEHKQLARSFEIDPAIVVKVGDVLISRACGSPNLVGSVGRVKSLRFRLILSDKTFRAYFRDCVDVDFMVSAMNCSYYRQQVEQAISGAEGMANNLPLSSLRSFIFAIPPMGEAAAIAEYLERETAGVQKAINRLEREIELLREYRTRLVADVVTGKLDVREAAARLPDEVTPAIAEDADLSVDPETADEEAVV
jgi:type I restriction enzyme S subunit